jgi:FHS family L-fucose permease-like MFS transporter
MASTLASQAPASGITGSASALRTAAYLVTSLFFLWGLVNNSLPAIVPKVQEACRLNDVQVGFVASAFWVAYFVMAMPAGIVMRRFGYKGAIVAGLSLGALGCALFISAAWALSFSFFLIALFVLSSGMAFLETAANPYMAVLGDPAKAANRLNFAQAFNGLAAFVASLWLSKLILGTPKIAAAEMAILKTTDEAKYLLALAEDAKSVTPTFLAIGGALAITAVVFFFVNLPDTREHQAGASELEEEKGLFAQLFSNKYFLFGVFTQFCYVGAQVGVDDFFLRYVPDVTGLSKIDATTYLGLVLGCFMLGRVLGTSLMTRISARTLLGIFAAANIVLLGYCGFAPKYIAPTHVFELPGWLLLGDKLVLTTHPAPYVLMGVKFFMSIMFPTIFSLGLTGLGKATKLGSTLLVMSIVGGAMFPPFMGWISKTTGVFAYSYLAPMVCTVVVLAFSFAKPTEPKEPEPA